MNKPIHDERGVLAHLVDVPEPRQTDLRADWSLRPTDPPIQILDGDQYDARDIGCARCGAKFPSAPWPRQEAICFRPRCSHCGSSFTFPLQIK